MQILHSLTEVDFKQLRCHIASVAENTVRCKFSEI